LSSAVTSSDAVHDAKEWLLEELVLAQAAIIMAGRNSHGSKAPENLWKRYRALQTLQALAGKE